MLHKRIRMPSLHSRIMSAAKAAELVKHGMTLGLSGCGCSGDAKAVPYALIERARHSPLTVSLVTGASIGNGIDGMMAEVGLVSKRKPFQADPALRRAINSGKVMFVDQHLSETAEQMRHGQIDAPDIMVVEAVAITEEGHIVPTSSVGNSGLLVQMAKQVIVEININTSLDWEGLHDIYLPEARPNRSPMAITSSEDRIGTSAIPLDPDKIAAIVISEYSDAPATILPPDEDTRRIADHLIGFLKDEVDAGRLSNNLAPLQVGVGSIANAVMSGLADSPFEDLVMWSEILQDSTFELMDAGKMKFASATSVILTEALGQRVFANIGEYAEKIVLRPQDVSNHPELIRRLGPISINTALEFDLYGNVNSTLIGGTDIMNGIGGSGDFARNTFMSIFVTKSTAKNGAISRVVPMVSHVDHIQQDIDILVTEQGLADLRDLAPRERAKLIIEHCAHPDYREALWAYFDRACAKGGHTPHDLSQALSWHVNLESHGRMLVS